MSTNRSGWEGSALLFLIVFTILIGVGYNTAFAYRLPVPWLLILLLSVVVTLLIRFVSRRARRP